MKRLSLYALCILALSAKAQDGYINTTISVPPAPTAASLGKYGDVPVGLYTGVPNIGIPLYNIAEGNLSLPVSLSYHSQGFKTEDMASSVGLGWSLNAGGVITRAVKGVPDDFNGDLWGSNVTNFANQQCPTTTPLYSDCRYPSYGYLSTAADVEANSLDMEEASRNSKDGEQDIFYFNFAGNSGSFVFNKDGVPKFFSKQNLEITYSRNTNGDIYKFQVIDGNGTIYYFEDYEVTTSSYSHSSYNSVNGNFDGNELFQTDESPNSDFIYPTFQDPFISSWNLTKIKNATGTHEINFTYVNETQRYKSNFSQQYAYGPTSNNFSSSCSVASVVCKKISVITWSEGKVTFSYNHERQDIGCNIPAAYYSYSPNYAVTDVGIYTTANTLIKKYVLDYNYFGRAPFANPASNTVSNFDCNYRKLKLLSVKEYNSALNEYKPPFVFDYNTTTALEPTFTAKKDFWGYQKSTSPGSYQSRIPKVYYYPSETKDQYFKSIFSIYQRFSYGGSEVVYGNYDISPEAAGQTAFLLTKVTYPTGGSTSFEFEPHQFALFSANKVGGGARIKKITDSDGAGNNIIKNYSYTDENNVSLSSGVVMSLPVFAKRLVSCNANGGATISSKSISGLGSTFGSVVGYKRVVVEYNGNGKTESFFNTQGAIGSAMEECVGSNCMYVSTGSAFTDYTNCNEDNFPFAENPNFDWFRGVLNEERVYNSSSQLVRKTINEYTTKNYEKLKCIKAGIYNSASSGYPQVTKYASYYLLSGWKVLSKQTTTDYDVLHAGRQLQTVVNYYYDNADHLQLTKTSTADSKGRITETVYRRSKDYTGSGTILTTLNNQHRLNEVLEKQVWLSGSPKKLLGAEFTDYAEYSTTNGNLVSQFLPSKKYILETAAPIASTAFNDTYFSTNPVLDSRYKLVSELNFDKKDNLTRRSLYNTGLRNHSTAIFGYSKNKVIANVENAREIECGFTSFESDDQNLWENSGSFTLSSDAHCGIASCNMAPAGVVARNYFIPVNEQNKKFILSCWIKTNSAAAGTVGELVLCTIANNGSNLQYPGDTEARQSLPFGNTNGQWKYIEVETDLTGIKNVAGIPLSTDLGIRSFVWNTSGSTQILVDDLRFYPKDARMSSYTYIPLIGVSSMSDENSNCIFYEYDTFGRLKLTKDQNGKILEKTDYNYKP